MKQMSLFELQRRFPSEAAAIAWFENLIWSRTGRSCGHCGSVDTYRIQSRRPLPYRCRDCKRYFSVKTGTIMASSPLPVQKWVYAVYLDVTHPKGISSMQLHRDIGVCQKTAWFMLQRIRKVFAVRTGRRYAGPVEVDETYIGGKERNKHWRKRLGSNWPQGKTVVVGAKDRNTNRVSARVIPFRSKKELFGFINDHTDSNTMINTDGASSYRGRKNHESVAHTRGEYVRGDVHTNGIESFWAILKRAYMGTWHYVSPKHLHRYLAEMTARHNMRGLDTMSQLERVAERMVGLRLTYEELIA